MFRKILLILIVFFVGVNSAFASEDFNAYLKTLKTNVKSNWTSPSYGIKYTSDVYFKVKKDGTLYDVKVVKSSRVPKFDKSVIEAVNKSSALDTLPSFYTSDYIEVTLSFENPVNRYIKKTVYTKKKKRVQRVKTIPVSPKAVKVKKVIYLEHFQCNSNYQDKMLKPVLNLDIQRARGL